VGYFERVRGVCEWVVVGSLRRAALLGFTLRGKGYASRVYL